MNELCADQCIKYIKDNLYISYDNIMKEMMTKFKNEFNGNNIVINTFSFNTCGIIEYKKNDKSNNHLTEEKENLLAKYETEIKKYYAKFVETRKENLGVYLKESRYTSNNLEEIRKIYESIKKANNDDHEGIINYVYFLDILPTANYISKMNSNILEKYEFVVDKIK